MSSSAGAGACAVRTVTRTVASVLPPSPFAVRWKSVELVGATVCVPFVLTGPMPSIVTEVAFVVRQFRTTDWPASTEVGSALMVAVGAGIEAGGGGGGGGGGAVFLWQPDKVATAIAP